MGPTRIAAVKWLAVNDSEGGPFFCNQTFSFFFYLFDQPNRHCDGPFQGWKIHQTRCISSKSLTRIWDSYSRQSNPNLDKIQEAIHSNTDCVLFLMGPIMDEGSIWFDAFPSMVPRNGIKTHRWRDYECNSALLEIQVMVRMWLTYPSHEISYFTLRLTKFILSSEHF